MQNQIQNISEPIYRLGLDLGTSSIGWAIVKFSPLVTYDIDNKENTQYIYEKIIAMGSRIFSDGRTSSKSGGLGESLAAARRQARQARRQIDRKHGRRLGLFYALQKIGLMPLDKYEAQELKKENPYQLRSKGVDEILNPYELGRSLFHLQQKRGFKSSRKDLQKAAQNNDNLDKNELNKIQQGLSFDEIEKLYANSSVKKSIAKEYSDIKEAGLKTVGQLLFSKWDKNQATLCKKINKKNKQGQDIAGVESYENYFDRSMIEYEFNILWDTQAKFWQNDIDIELQNILSPENKKLIYEKIFFQRPLKDASIGFCTYIKGENRAAKCLPSSELYRIWQDTSNLNLKPTILNENAKDKTLTLIEKQILVTQLIHQEKITFNKVLEIIFNDDKAHKKWKCNLDSTQKKDKELKYMQGALSYSQLISILGFEQCQQLGINKLDTIVSLVFQDKEFLSLEAQLYIKKRKNRLDVKQIENLFSQELQNKFNFDNQTIQKLNAMKLNDDYMSISSKAMNEMLEYMNGAKSGNYTDEKGEIIYINQEIGATQYQAKKLCGFKDNLYDKDKAVDELQLPYYGEIVGQYCIPQKHLFEYLQLNKDKLHKNTQDEISIGKITNPSVHIALNELRKIINLLLIKYKNIFNNGKPDNIHIELSRDLCLGQESVEEIIRKQNKNEKKNQEYKAELLNIHVMPTRDNILKLSLYKYLTALNIDCCIYSGIKLPSTSTELFNNSADWQIDHIFPRSRSFDDSRMNKLLIHRSANQDKGESTPWEYVTSPKFSSPIEEYIQRVNLFPPDEVSNGKLIKRSRRWVFLEEGNEYLKNNPAAKKHDRLLNDTRYMTRVARMYLQALYDKYDNEGKEQRNNKVLALPSGKITSAIRNEWHLNSVLWTQEQKEVNQDIKIQLDKYKNLYKQDKNKITKEELEKYDILKDISKYPIDREIYNYFHTLIDRQVNSLSDAEKKDAVDKFYKALGKIKNRNDHRHHALDAVVIAMADVKLIQQAGAANKSNDLKKKDKRAKLINQPPPYNLKADLIDRVTKINVSHKPDHATEGRLHEETARFKTMYNAEIVYTYDKKHYREFGTPKDPIKKAIGIKRDYKNEQEQPYKYYKLGSNYCYEIYINDKGKIDGDVINTYTANQKAYKEFMHNKALFDTTTFAGKPLIMRLIMGDMLQIQVEGEAKLVYIQKMDEANGICLNEHFEANCDARYRAKLKGNSFIIVSVSPNILISKYKAQKVFVSPIGKVQTIKKYGK